MIRMSKQTDYGIVLLTHLASTPDASYSARELAAVMHLPLPMVSKILKLLTREGLLFSYRGPSGGYRLARQPNQITVAEMINALEGPFAFMECIETPGTCRQESFCPVRGNWYTINSTVVRALRGITLSDMTGTIPGMPGAGASPQHPGGGQLSVIA
jgi:FeS assembly SUF system regulator